MKCKFWHVSTLNIYTLSCPEQGLICCKANICYTVVEDDIRVGTFQAMWLGVGQWRVVVVMRWENTAYSRIVLYFFITKFQDLQIIRHNRTGNTILFTQLICWAIYSIGEGWGVKYLLICLCVCVGGGTTPKSYDSLHVHVDLHLY